MSSFSSSSFSSSPDPKSQCEHAVLRQILLFEIYPFPTSARVASGNPSVSTQQKRRGYLLFLRVLLSPRTIVPSPAEGPIQYHAASSCALRSARDAKMEQDKRPTDTDLTSHEPK